MIDYWSEAQAFFPHNPFSTDMLYFMIRLGSIFIFHKTSVPNDASVSGIIMCIILVISFLIGIINLIRHKRIKEIILTCTPFLLHIILSAFQLYPVSTRMILYMLPCIIIISTEGFDHIKIFSRLKPSKKKLTAISFSILLLFCCLDQFPIQREEIKDSIKYIAENIHEKEKVYVHKGAINAFNYYTDINFMNYAHVVYSQSGWEREECVNELKKLQGRNWLLFSHLFDYDEKFIINQLDSLDYKKIRTFKGCGSSAYLYDLGEY
jgi:hypothetical protein